MKEEHFDFYKKFTFIARITIMMFLLSYFHCWILILKLDTLEEKWGFSTSDMSKYELINLSNIIFITCSLKI